MGKSHLQDRAKDERKVVKVYLKQIGTRMKYCKHSTSLRHSYSIQYNTKSQIGIKLDNKSVVLLAC